MSNKRKTIGNKVRFEVFKRDSFTCQYCGKGVPDVVLEVDHINPVKEGGDNNILNLITSCKECNSGKGARKLNDHSLLKIEKQKLTELNEKRIQLEEMMRWRHELMDLEETQVAKIDQVLGELIGVELTETGRKTYKNLIKKHGFKQVLEAVDASVAQYWNSQTRNTDEVLKYIKKICVYRAKDKYDPLLKDKMYIYGILRNRVYLYSSDKSKIPAYLNRYCTSFMDVQLIKDIAKTIDYISDFYEELDDMYGG